MNKSSINEASLLIIKNEFAKLHGLDALNFFCTTETWLGMKKRLYKFQVIDAFGPIEGERVWNILPKTVHTHKKNVNMKNNPDNVERFCLNNHKRKAGCDHFTQQVFLKCACIELGMKTTQDVMSWARDNKLTFHHAFGIDAEHQGCGCFITFDLHKYLHSKYGKTDDKVPLNIVQAEAKAYTERWGIEQPVIVINSHELSWKPREK